MWIRATAPLCPPRLFPYAPEVAKSSFREFLGKRCSCTYDGQPHVVKFIDWAKFPGKGEWLQDTFGDCEIPGDYPGLLADSENGYVWTSKTMVPFALLGEQQGSDDGQLEAILLHDPAKPEAAIYVIEVDGTALPAKKPAKKFASFAALEVSVAVPAPKPPKGVPSFDDARGRIVSSKIDGEARKLLAQLTGDKDAGHGYIDPYAKKKPKPPAGRDPRWIDALGEELARSIVWASTCYQSETYYLAGALVSFGHTAVPALVGALDDALAKYPAKSLDYGVEPVFRALDALGSDDGIRGALTILDRATRPEKSSAIGPALAYLARRKNPKITATIKKLAKRPKIEKAPYWNELEKLAGR